MRASSGQRGQRIHPWGLCNPPKYEAKAIVRPHLFRNREKFFKKNAFVSSINNLSVKQSQPWNRSRTDFTHGHLGIEWTCLWFAFRFRMGKIWSLAGIRFDPFLCGHWLNPISIASTTRCDQSELACGRFKNSELNLFTFLCLFSLLLWRNKSEEKQNFFYVRVATDYNCILIPFLDKYVVSMKNLGENIEARKGQREISCCCNGSNGLFHLWLCKWLKSIWILWGYDL